ncbi:MAG: DUF1028 domain-containing protein [Verrucomicrobia bacterium]|nr:DUF1028 domain-containing protein [Verrucomicrobiota bacterium]
MRAHPCSTYSLILRDPSTGWIGSAVASRYLAVGGAVAHVLPGAGVVHSQFWCCHDTALVILKDMAAGMSAQNALATAVATDPKPQKRQILAMDIQGRTAVHTGADATPSHAQIARQDFVAAGNTLVSEGVIGAIAQSIETSKGKSLLLQLIRALEAAEAKGGDYRGKQSAAVRVIQPMGRSWSDAILDLRVDDHPSPIEELNRLYGLACETGTPPR